MDNEHLFASAELLADKELKYGRARKVLTSKFLSDALVLEAVGDEAVARLREMEEALKAAHEQAHDSVTPAGKHK